MVDVTKPFWEGYSDQQYGATKRDNPYDPRRQPTLYHDWKEGWKASHFDAVSIK